MRCYFDLVRSECSLADEEGLEVANLDEARTLAREAVTTMLQDGLAELAHWRGWEIEARDGYGNVLFSVAFEAMPTAEEEEVGAREIASSLTEDEGPSYEQAA